MAGDPELMTAESAYFELLGTVTSFELAGDTLVLFTSDNGGLSRVTSNVPLREGKGAPYEGGIRVPAIVRWPSKIPAGRTTAPGQHPRGRAVSRAHSSHVVGAQPRHLPRSVEGGLERCGQRVEVVWVRLR